MKWFDDHQAALVIFASLGLKIAIFYTVKMAIKLYPLFFCCWWRRFEWTPTSNQWAVVTGATDGLGLEFARQLALKGYNLLLISRNEERLQQTRRQIQLNLTLPQNNGITTGVDVLANTSPRTVEMQVSQLETENLVEIRTLAVDLSHLYVYKKVEQFLSTSTNEIAILVNNAGVSPDIPGRFIEEDAVAHQEMINVNVVAPTRLLELVLPSMVQRKGGLIVNVSALGGKHISPLSSAFTASKAYLSQLSESLAEEHRKDGLTFITLHPLSVSTKASQYAQVGTFTPTAEAYVTSALASIRYRDSLSTTGYWSHSLTDAALKLLTNFFSHQKAGRIIQSMLEKKRTQLLEIHKVNGSLSNGNTLNVVS